MQLITLLTDFGDHEPFVGVMKGVLLSRAPAARLVDLTHGLAAGDIAAGAFWLARSVSWFPPETVHLAVVDPGVGSERRALAVRAGDQWLVGPDNGLLAEAAALDEGARAFTVDWRAHGWAAPSRTFHGRDVFAPLAAELATGRLDATNVGAPLERWVPSPLPAPVRSEFCWSGAIVVADRFGNLLTNLPAEALDGAVVWVNGAPVRSVDCYAAGEPNELVALANAQGVVELAVRDGSALARGLAVGSAVELRQVRP